MEITITTVENAKNLVNLASKKEYSIDVISGKYVVDAKSIMGVLSLDISKPVKIEANCTKEQAESFYSEAREIIK